MTLLRWAYVGEFIDPDQTPITASLFACAVCGALSTRDWQTVHERSHALAAPSSPAEPDERCGYNTDAAAYGRTGGDR